MFTKESMKSLTDFVVARHQVYVNRAAGKPAPWTKDPILQTYRFCNIYRELDRVTLYVRNHWTAKHMDQKHIWFAMVVARLLNWPDSMDELHPVTPWRPARFLHALQQRQQRGQQVFGPAYIVSTNGQSVPKLQYLAEQVLTPMWHAREDLRPVDGMLLSEFHANLMRFQGMGSFMAAQVVADVKNTRDAGLGIRLTADWFTWAAPGPGSMRGMNRLLGNGPLKSGMSPVVFLERLNMLREQVNAVLVRKGWTPLCAQDMQNCLCEYDKYERVRLGQGTPKQLFRATEAPITQGVLL